MPIVADTSSVFRQAVPAKRQAFHIASGQAAVCRVAMRNTDGVARELATNDDEDPPVDETEGVSYRALTYDAIRGPRYATPSAAVIVTDAQNEVDVAVPTAVARVPGIYIMDCGMFQDDVLQFNQASWLFVEQSSWGDTRGRGKLPSLQEIRQNVQQSDLLENLLREEWVYDLADICAAAVRALQFWNDQLPTIAAATFFTGNFPFPDLWQTGIQLFLFQAAEEWYRRNKLPYSAGGTQTDDMRRDAEYKQAWQERMAAYTEMVRSQKARINIARGYGSMSQFRPGYF